MNNKTKTGALIGAGTPERTSEAQANINRAKLGLPLFVSKFKTISKDAVNDSEFLDVLLYVVAPIYALCFSIISFLEFNKELWK